MTVIDFVIPGNLDGAPTPYFYRPWVLRFARKFVEFPPRSPHRLILINSNNGLDDEVRGAFGDIPHEVVDYNGTGYDIGAHQHLARQLDPEEWLMCFSSYAWFRQHGWLEEYVKAREIYGDTLYGAMASKQYRLHVRGTGFMCKAKHIQEYPVTVTTKVESFDFESGPNSLTMRMLAKGEIYLVTPTGIHTSGNMRLIPNGFRSGDQSNTFVYDKHSDYYDNAPQSEKDDLRKITD